MTSDIMMVLTTIAASETATHSVSFENLQQEEVKLRETLCAEDNIIQNIQISLVKVQMEKERRTRQTNVKA